MVGGGAAGGTGAKIMGGLSKVASNPTVQAGGAKIASGLSSTLGGASSAMGAGGAMAKGALAATGFFGAKFFLESITKDFWFGFTLAGLFYYLFKLWMGVESAAIFAIFLLVGSLIILMTDKSWSWGEFVVNAFIFGIGYYLITLYTGSVGAIVVVVSLLIFDLIEKKRTGNNSASKMQIDLVLIIVTFLFGAGLHHYVFELFNLSILDYTFISVLLYIPWFSLLGAIKINPSVGMGKTVKMLIFIYLFFAIIGSIGFSLSAADDLTGVDFNEIIQTDQDARAEIEDRPNPAFLQLKCMMSMFSHIGDSGSYSVESCVQDEMIEYEAKKACNGKSGSFFTMCVEKEEERLKEEGEIISGTSDKDIEKETTANFVIDKDTFPSDITRKYGQVIQYPMNLEIENPHELELKVKLGCKFQTKDDIQENEFNLEGEILPNGQDTISLNEEENTIGRICKVPDGFQLNGTHKVKFYAEFEGLKTDSYLTRMFVEKYDKDNSLLKDAKTQYLSGSSRQSSSGKEFARINFAFGEPETNSVIEKEDYIMMVTSIENLENGGITKINSYNINLEPDLMVVDDYSCISGNGDEITLPERMIKGQDIPVSVCFLELSQEIKDQLSGSNFLLNTYIAELDYNYQIEEDVNLRVNLVNS